MAQGVYLHTGTYLTDRTNFCYFRFILLAGLVCSLFDKKITQEVVDNVFMNFLGEIIMPWNE